jgi:MFS family permease
MGSHDTAPGYPPAPRPAGHGGTRYRAATVPSTNAIRLLAAGFFAIFASGVGFGVRTGVLVDWAREYGFTQSELGDISGGGLVGFGFIIILGSLIADRIGYGKLMILSFVMHVSSALLQIATPAIFAAYGREGVLFSLYVAMFMFSIGNGICEVVVNPMVATLFPDNKTHYLNILHAGWPGGLIVGGMIAFFFNEVIKVHWIIQMSLFLVPVAFYGLLLLGQHLPRSEAGEAGISYGVMLAQFLSPVLITLLIIHAMVGYVELGTDSWISKITGSIMSSRGAGLLLFIYTSGLMFILRFCAGPIERATSPLGLLFVCSILASIGLLLLGFSTAAWMCIIAATIYGVGKTFFWPTMLAVVSERFPKGGAITIGAVGGVGMLSAGFLGSPGIGFTQDFYAAQDLKKEDPAAYERYAAEKPNTFLGVFETRGLDGTKTSLVDLASKARDPKASEADRAAAQRELDLTLENIRKSKDGAATISWWERNQDHAVTDRPFVDEAGLFGGRMALKWTAVVPATMAVLYLGLILYFRTQGGYRRVTIETPYETAAPAADM